MRTGDQLVGRYRLDARLGYGGMGEVWRGYDAELGRAVALKLLRDVRASDELLQRFRREASTSPRTRCRTVAGMARSACGGSSG